MNMWGLVTAGAVLGTLGVVLRRRWKKRPEEKKGALNEILMAVAACTTIVIVLSVLSSLASCTYYREHSTEVTVFAGFDPSGSPFGRTPTGNILIVQPLPGYAQLFIHHESSMPDFMDKADTNEFGFGFCVKIPLRTCD